MIKLSEQENKTDRIILYLYKNKRGYIEGSIHPLLNNTSMKAMGAYKVSPKEQVIIQNFEYPHQNQDDFFIEEFMGAYISRMFEILLSEGVNSHKFIRIRKREVRSFVRQIEKMEWDPGKGKEVKSFTEQKISIVKSKVVYMLKEFTGGQ